MERYGGYLAKLQTNGEKCDALPDGNKNAAPKIDGRQNPMLRKKQNPLQEFSHKDSYRKHMSKALYEGT